MRYLLTFLFCSLALFGQLNTPGATSSYYPVLTTSTLAIGDNTDTLLSVSGAGFLGQVKCAVTASVVGVLGRDTQIIVTVDGKTPFALTVYAASTTVWTQATKNLAVTNQTGLIGDIFTIPFNMPFGTSLSITFVGVNNGGIVGGLSCNIITGVKE